MELLENISEEDHLYLTEIIELAQGQKLDAAESLSPEMLFKLQMMFEDMTYDEVKELSEEAVEREASITPKNKQREIEDTNLEKVKLVTAQTFVKLMR